jgi:glycosyltransferase involved in cell wall biosynthesis
MKIGYVFPPMWSPVSNGSLSLWNSHVTRRLAPHCETIVYGHSPSSGTTTAWREGVEYRYVSSRLDIWFRDHPNVFFPRRTASRPIYSSDLYYLGFALEVSRDLRRQRCDVAHVYYFPQFIPIIKALNPRVRIVLHMHGEWLTQLAWSRIERKLRKCDLILGCSEFITNKIRRSFPHHAARCTTVFMGVDPNHFQRNALRTPSTSPAASRILYVGRISPEKGVHDLLDAFRTILCRRPDTELDLVGPEWKIPPEDLIDLSEDPRLVELKRFYSGSYIALLKEMLPASAAEHVHFVGLVPQEDLAPYYQNASVFVNPSLYETLGMSVLEAMASGLPVVATQVGGVPEVLTDGDTGLLVKPADANALASAILRVLGDPTLRVTLATAARTHVADRFSWDTICRQLLGLYSTLS